MLRRPSECLAVPREEGCSSTAFASLVRNSSALWFNLAGRGSAEEFLTSEAALP
jgi:hypothetical protein